MTTTSNVIRAGEMDLPWLDREDPAWAADPIPIVRELHNTGWLARSQLGIEVLSLEVNESLHKDQRVQPAMIEYWKTAPALTGNNLYFVEDGLLPGVAGERHQRIRKVLQKAFLARRIDEQREMIRTCAHRLVDRFIEQGSCDFVDDFTHHLPIEVVCSFMGVPEEDVPAVQDWTYGIGAIARLPLGSGFADSEQALTSFVDYLETLLAERARRPADDFLTTLLEAERTGTAISHHELLFGLVNILFAGHDTTRYQFASTMYLLLADRSNWEAILADTSLHATAVEEGLRMHPANRTLIRRPVEEVCYRDVLFDASEPLITNAWATNFDPTIFADPERFDLHRANAGRHLTFGTGAHYCLGHRLARVEMTEGIGVLVDRVPDLRLVDVDFSSKAEMMGGPHHLTLEFTSGKAGQR